MEIAIFILAYILYLDDILNIIMGKDSNILVSGGLITLLSWQVSTPWGITMCAISAILIIIVIISRSIK
jgi:hypothetical protein